MIDAGPWAQGAGHWVATDHLRRSSRHPTSTTSHLFSGRARRPRGESQTRGPMVTPAPVVWGLGTEGGPCPLTAPPALFSFHWRQSHRLDLQRCCSDRRARRCGVSLGRVPRRCCRRVHRRGRKVCLDGHLRVAATGDVGSCKTDVRLAIDAGQSVRCPLHARTCRRRAGQLAAVWSHAGAPPDLGALRPD